MLKKQIRERVELENKILEAIKKGGNHTFFEIEIWEEEDRDTFRAGCFASFEYAERYAKDCSKPFTISKYEICTHPMVLDEDENDDMCLAQVRYDEHGEMISYWMRNTDNYVRNDVEIRFENSYVKVFHPFKQGGYCPNCWYGGGGNCKRFLVRAKTE